MTGRDEAVERMWMDGIEEESDWTHWTVTEHLQRAQGLLRDCAAAQRRTRGLIRTITPIEVLHAQMHLQMAAIKKDDVATATA